VGLVAVYEKVSNASAPSHFNVSRNQVEISGLDGDGLGAPLGRELSRVLEDLVTGPNKDIRF
jgi:hypothetical protein